MKYVNGRNLFGSGPSKEIPCLTGKGQPTTATVGAVGCLYMDTDTGALYKCTKAENGVYTWTQEAGLYYTPVVTQPSATTMKITFRPSVSGAPTPAPVVVELPVSSSDGENADGGLNDTAKNLLITILRSGVYSTDQSDNITALEAALSVSGGTEDPDDPETPESGVIDNGRTLVITGGVTVTEDGDTLRFA